jgi:hypothetical protein
MSYSRTVTVLLIIFLLLQNVSNLQNVNCSRSACKGGQQRRGEDYLEWGIGVVVSGDCLRWHWVATGGGALSFLLLPRAEAPAFGFFFPFLICFCSNLLSSFFLFCLSRKTFVCLPKISFLPLLFQPLLSIIPSLFSFPSSLLFLSLPMLFFFGSPSLCSL